MVYPENFEHKIGFDEVRTLLKGRCLSSLGTEWVDNGIQFFTTEKDVKRALSEAGEMQRFLQAEEGDALELNICDVRQALSRIRPERTWMEEVEFFDLKRSLRTVGDFVSLVSRPADSDDDFPFQKEGREVPEGFSDMTDGTADRPLRYPALYHLVEGVSAFPELVKRIDEVLNKYGKVKDTASPELLTIRHSMEQTLRSISHSLRSIINEAQQEGYIDRDVSPTMRDGRLVIPVAPALKRKIRGIVHDESATGKTVFIEPAAVVEANNRIRELKAAERREIIRILQELTAAVRPHVTEILASQTLLGHIDYLRALSGWSEATDSIVPQVAGNPVIKWNKAYHPLLQQSLHRHGKEMTPLDIVLPQGKRILLISGPNAGGKSVCLKTAGLLQYMLQCGMPVPVSESSVTGIFSDIFIDIGDEQSLEDELSTYSGHLFNMKQMMRHAGRRSLLLIDEFGSGTEPQIGGAMAEAIMERFVENGVTGIITTHYQNLKHFAKETQCVVNGAMLYDRTQMQPLFVLQVGNPGSSFAIEIARKIGLPEEVIDKAAQIVGRDYVMSDKYLLDIVRDKTYWENKRKQIHQREKQLEDTIGRYEKDMEDFQSERKDILRKAKDEAENLLQSANAKIEYTIRSIKEAQAEKEQTKAIRQELEAYRNEVTGNSDTEDKIARKIAQIKRRQERKAANGKLTGLVSALSSRSPKVVQTVPQPARQEAPFHTGDFVRMEGQSSVGRISEIQGKRAKVLFGMMFTYVKLSRLRHAEAPAEDRSIKVATFVSKETRDAVYEKKLHFKPEIDIRGMRADEALQAVSYFIDDAILLEQSRVRILHGTGTGALRELVRQYLASTPGVKRYHDEHVQFGGAGITVAELD